MKKEVLQQYIKDRLTSVKEHLEVYQKEKNPESLHRLRVEIKKIRAIVSFAKKVYKQPYTTSKLLPLFRLAGKIRELGIHLRQLSAMPGIPDDRIDTFKKEETLLEQQFIQNSPLYIENVNRFQEELSLPAKLPGKKTIRSYFEKKQEKANRQLQKKDRESMHEFRKNTKQLMYVYTALPGKQQKRIALNKAEMNQWQEQIGQWHDTYSTIAFLSEQPFAKTIPQQLLQLHEKEEKEFDALVHALK